MGEIQIHPTHPSRGPPEGPAVHPVTRSRKDNCRDGRFRQPEGLPTQPVTATIGRRGTAAERGSGEAEPSAIGAALAQEAGKGVDVQ